jgi:large subunit ribosomal protein L22
MGRLLKELLKRHKNMEAISVQKYVRMSPTKIRLVANMVKDVTPTEAVAMLPYVPKRAAKPLEKVVRSAIANARQKGAKEEDLVFKEIQINEGPHILKRGQPVSRGQWHPILKKMSHIRVVLMTKPEAKSNVKKSKQGKKGGKLSINKSIKQ